ncbi:MAG: M23 family metallopeptidase, partial [Clostridiales Family XIII bacterium]|nr:M23 family metallopeptidase [Clostridiales Family XIII bacterium]
TPIVASNGGTVIMAGWNNSYGNVVMVDHGGKIVTLYAHNSSLAVSEGDIVGQGQTIAYAGSTGNSTGPHCHFEVRVNGEYQDPEQWVRP